MLYGEFGAYYNLAVYIKEGGYNYRHYNYSVPYEYVYMYYFTISPCSVWFFAAITPSGTPVIGRSFSLLCTVTETDSLHLTISYYWLRGQLPLTTNSGLLTFDTLFLSDAGLYRCEVTVSSEEHKITVNSSYDINFKSKQFLRVQYIASSLQSMQNQCE